METVNLKKKKKEKKEQNSGLHAHFPSNFLSDKHYNSMHCQWHYSHWKIIQINRKRKITFFISGKGKKKNKKREKIIVNCYL